MFKRTMHAAFAPVDAWLDRVLAFFGERLTKKGGRPGGWISQEALMPKPKWADQIEEDFHAEGLMDLVREGSSCARLSYLRGRNF